MRKGKDRSSEYKMARTLAPDGSGKKTRQEDPLRGNVHEPLKSTEIKQMYNYLRRGIRAPTSTSNRPLTSPYERARDAVMLGMTTVGISRGDDVRHPEVWQDIVECCLYPNMLHMLYLGVGKYFLSSRISERITGIEFCIVDLYVDRTHLLAWQIASGSILFFLGDEMESASFQIFLMQTAIGPRKLHL